MSKLARWLLLALVLSFALLGSLQRGALAQEADDEELSFEEETEDSYEDEAEAEELAGDWEVSPNEDVLTSYWFPQYPEQAFPLGKPIDVIVNLHNKGRQTFNVSYVQVSFRSPYDLSYHIQNFTARGVNALLGPQQELNVEYTFMPDPNLDPTKFHLTGYVGFNSTAGRPFMNIWADHTVEMLAGPLQFDLTITLQYLLLVAIAVGVWWLVNMRGAASSSGKPKKAAAAAAGGDSKSKSKKDSEDAVSSGWENLVYQPSKDSKPVRRRK